MHTALEPLSEVPGELVRTHLLNYGLSAEIIQWKYLERPRGVGGERGFVWMRNGTVVGMIGLIPVVMQGPSTTVSTAWTCDWSVADPARNPGLGVLVLKGAIERAGLLMTVGGNEMTERLVPRMAAHRDAEAAHEYALPLRWGGLRLIAGLDRRLRLPGGRWLRQLSLPVRREGLDVSTQPGVHSGIESLVGQPADGTWRPVYSRDQLDWQLARCPAVEATSAFVANGARLRAVAVFWRMRADARQWRVAFWMQPGDAAAGAAVLTHSARCARSEGGEAISIVAGRDDRASLGVIDTVGFRRTGKIFPLYLLARAGMTLPAPLGGFGFLDSDLGYRL